LKYKILTTQKFDKAFSKLDKYTQKIIKSWIVKNLVDTENPRIHGKGLVANKSGQWRYRIGDYRLLCDIQDDQLVIVMIDIGHRRNIYNKG
jgi:mRNA interferase RelE/StbE